MSRSFSCIQIYRFHGVRALKSTLKISNFFFTHFFEHGVGFQMARHLVGNLLIAAFPCSCRVKKRIKLTFIPISGVLLTYFSTFSTKIKQNRNSIENSAKDGNFFPSFTHTTAKLISTVVVSTAASVWVKPKPCRHYFPAVDVAWYSK